MAPHKPKPIERPPVGMPVPKGWGGFKGGRPYQPGDKPKQEDWKSVAEMFGVGVKELIYFNFETDNTDVVNWYLKRHVGCDKPSPSGNNWMFSSTAVPGIIYIPPLDLDFDEENLCSWTDKTAEAFLMKLHSAAQGMPGHRGARIKRLVNVIKDVGYPACKELWYYNTMVIRAYVGVPDIGDAKRRDMIKATLGAFEFDGESGLYAQHGTYEQHRGMWRIHAVRDLFEDFCSTSKDYAALRSRLESIDDDMYAGWHELELVEARAGMGGGTTQGDMIYDFIGHVRFLSKNNRQHLYWAFG